LGRFIDGAKLVATGSSPSVGGIINVGGKTYFAKITCNFGSTGDCDSHRGLMYERDVYAHILQDIYGSTPCLVRYVAFIRLPSDAVPKTRRRIIQRIKKKSGSCEIDACDFGVTLTEYVDGNETIFDFVQKRNKSLTAADFGPIIAQLVATLALMESIGLQHNDLHLSNVLCAPVSRNGRGVAGSKKLAANTPLIVDVGGRVLVEIVNARVQIFIFDWDLAYAKRLGKNANVTQFRGECSFVNDPRRIDATLDLWTFLEDLVRVVPRNKPLLAFVEDIFPNFVRNRSYIQRYPRSCEGHIPARLKKRVISSNLYKHGILEVLKHPFLTPYVKFV
jgi:hypothetical protein